ncbi:MAG: M23 family metallopeptidase [Gammaproteobacteria bacterium]|nr:M23 family metallopeptidase [Gammaproteobacteria bacterium]
MRIILVPNHKTNRSTRTFRARNIFIPAFLIVGILPIILGLGAYRINTALDRSPGFDQAEHELVQQALREQQRDLVDARSQVDHHLAALTRRVGRMQAQATRVNALGQRLAEKAGLDLDEFSFNRDPAVGGPETLTPFEDRVESDLARSLQALEVDLEQKRRELQVLQAMLSDRKFQEKRFPDGWPVTGGWVSSAYGYRTDPFTGRRAFHGGVDIAGRAGAPIQSVASGVVTQAGVKSGYGITVEVNHGGGFTTRYAHTVAKLVDIGDRVDKGQVIALMGSSGRSTGPHLHFEVLKEDRTVNPRKYLRASR